MKISFMLKREDFYKINENTLRKYYQSSNVEKKLYIYPELNAIVTARPSKTVKRYLYTEFRVNGSFLKRLLVRLYAMVLLNSGGLLASRALTIKTDAHRDTLIYPCNKKYRVFDFKENTVSVLGKDGFPTDDLQREIEFRSGHTVDFIPNFLQNNMDGYTEAIIDGRPVARTGERMNELCDRAFALWSDYISAFIRQVPAAEYADILEQRIQQLESNAVRLGKQINTSALRELTQTLLTVLHNDSRLISVGLSHGDLQPGNIWIENGTDKIYIIDWESWQERSTWYDRAALYEEIRKNAGLARYAKQRDFAHTTVLLEDIIFRLTELTALPYDYGCSEFDAYIKTLLGGNADV